MKKFVLLNYIFCFLSIQSIFAQGTGDSNVSLYGNIAPNLRENEDYFSISTLVRYDQGKNDVTSIAPMFKLDTNVNEQLDFQLWITSKHASGDLTNGFSLGDVGFIGAYHLTDTFLDDKKDQSIDFGLIMSLSGGKKLKIDSPTGSYYTYPMEYQSSLGTVDLIVGYTFKLENINLSAGFQQSVTSKNQNNFYPSYFGLGDYNENYPSSNEMKRAGNLYTRIGYSLFGQSGTFNKTTTSMLNIGLTGFYKITNDKVFNKSVLVGYPETGYYEVKGTSGLALNGVIQGNYELNNNAEIVLYGGIPLVQRKENIDGLERNYFVTIGLTWNF